jgi:hypothetical protein
MQYRVKETRLATYELGKTSLTFKVRTIFTKTYYQLWNMELNM